MCVLAQLYQIVLVIIIQSWILEKKQSFLGNNYAGLECERGVWMQQYKKRDLVIR